MAMSNMYLIYYQFFFNKYILIEQFVRLKLI